MRWWTALTSPDPSCGGRLRQHAREGSALVAGSGVDATHKQSSCPIDPSARRHRPHRQAMGGLRSRVIAGAPSPSWPWRCSSPPRMPRDRVSETPLPAGRCEARIAGANVPADRARFAGAWTVSDADGCSRSSSRTCSRRVARVVDSRGTSEALNIRQPGSWRATDHSSRTVSFASRSHDGLASADFEYRYRIPWSSTRLAQPGRALSIAVSWSRALDISTIGCSSRTNRRATPASGIARSFRPRRSARIERRWSPSFTTTPSCRRGMGPARRVLRARSRSWRGPSRAPTGTQRTSRCRRPRSPSPCSTHGERLVPVVRGFLPPSQLVIVSPDASGPSPGTRACRAPRSRSSRGRAQQRDAQRARHLPLRRHARVRALLPVRPGDRAVGAERLLGPSMAYVPGAIADEVRAARALRRGAASATGARRPWSALAGIGPPARARRSSTARSATDDVSASGLVVDGVLYVRGCNTRYRPLPVLPTTCATACSP